ncbi:hypothetical protein [Vulgatibacter incomptus]|uniref:CopG domain protein DNA-binding domain protein n=1 Tax=Vulgatibacter incomptus TaxID=1391653 RepID=A0A0K1PBV2_9BACT|nr:hypothetical protein [Vulgatibacter incomptus]AKU90599.1 CopG domain protein DNA-binding domain protein [Vulgatibacter incomptus]
MSEERFEIDYDAEAVFYESGWRTREDLARLIKEMIDRGDYRIARPSAALESLESELSRARIMAVRVSPELAKAAEQRAAREGKAVSTILREALAGLLSAPEAAKAPANLPAAVIPAIEVDAETSFSLDDPEMEQSWFGR